MGYEEASKLSRIVDLDVDIGADAVDYKWVQFGMVSSRFSDMAFQRYC